MLLPQRRETIMQMLSEKHSVSVHELSKLLFVSETSVRRDLTYLEKNGLLQKTYGGAVLLTRENQVLSLEARLRTESTAKNIIARKAVSFIQDGSIIFMDSSSTALAMVPYMGQLNALTVITNSARIALSLVEYKGIQVYCSGGQLTNQIYSYSGSLARNTLSKLQAGMLFVSPKSLDIDRGAFCASEEEADIRRVMLERSDRIVMLCSQHKMGRKAAFHLCDLEQIDILISDAEPTSSWKSCFEKNNILWR